MSASAVSFTGNANLVAPCAAEGFRLYSATTFTFQWVTRANEIDPASGAKAGSGVGAAVTAEQTSTTDFWLEIHAPLGNPFNPQELIGLIVAGAGVVFVRPIRPGGR